MNVVHRDLDLHFQGQQFLNVSETVRAIAQNAGYDTYTYIFWYSYLTPSLQMLYFVTLTSVFKVTNSNR